MNIKFLLGVCLIFLCLNFVSAQDNLKPSLLITQQFDTIIGTGNISYEQEYCLFKKFDSNAYTKYYPNEMKAFRIIDGKYFVSREVLEENGKMKWYFLELLVDGEVDIFYISNSGRYFIENETQGFTELNYRTKHDIKIDEVDYKRKDNKYKGYMKLYMSEAPELFEKIDQLNYLNQRKIVNLAVDYHNAVCNEYECVVYSKKIPKITYKFELLSGVTNHNSTYKPQVGLLVHIWRPLTNEKLYLKTGIIYSQKPYNRQGVILNNDGTFTTENAYSIKIPLSFQYVFGEKDFKPTLAFGWPTGIFLISSLQGGFIYSLSEKYELSVSGSIDGIIALMAKQHKNLYNNNFGNTINFGLIYNLN